MYHPFVEALALTLVDIPISLVTMVLFSVILYFLADLQESARQFLWVFLNNVCLNGARGQLINFWLF